MANGRSKGEFIGVFHSRLALFGPKTKAFLENQNNGCFLLLAPWAYFMAYFATMRIIRRYSNRKLYDTQESHYVTLSQVAALVRNGEEIRVIAKDTNSDLTAATLALIIFEEEKRGPRLPVAGLRRIIQTGVI